MSDGSQPSEVDAGRARDQARAYVGAVVGGRYRIDSVVAMGGMGAVFRAEHVHMRKRVAVKLLHPSTQNLPELVERFERESIVGAHVQHPNVCAATDFGRLDDGSHYLVLEFVDGRTLTEVLKEGAIEPMRALEIARQMAAGLGAAHALGIHHRDVKPSNVMLAQGSGAEQVKIVDFGLAKIPIERFHVEESLAVTTAGTVFGTVAYMAPELARGMQAVDHRSDLYALGVVFYEMLTGKHPFDEKESIALFRAHRRTPPPPFAERAPGRAIPAGIEAVVRKLLAKEPEQRYQSADELLDALDAIAPPISVPRSGRSSGRRDLAALRGSSGGTPKPAAREAVVPDPEDASPPSAAADPEDGDGAPRSGSSLPKWVFAAALVVFAVGAVRQLAPDVWKRIGIEQRLGIGRGSAPAATATATTTATAAATATATATAAATAAATATATATATAAATASAEIAPVGSASPAEIVRLRAILHDAAAAKDGKRGAQAVLDLAAGAPQAFRDADVVAGTAAVLVLVGLGDRGDDLFALVAGERLGGAGPDVLYYVTSFYGGSRGAARATELLARPEVIARATPALRVLRDLKAATCKGRAELFDRAADEGDERSLALLSAMLVAECPDTPGACCAPFDPKLAAAVTKLRERIKSQ